MRPDVTSGAVDVDGTRLHYIQAGHGPLVVCHHGFPSCSWSFMPMMDALADEFRVVSVDGLGANRSTKPRDLSRYRVENLIELLDTFVAEISNEARFTLIGHDWGAALAWAFAQAKPDRLSGVVAVSAPPYNQLIRLLQTSSDQRKRSSYMWTMREGQQHALITQHTDAFYEYIYGPLRTLDAFDDVVAQRLKAALAQPGAVDGGIDWYRANIPSTEALASFEAWPSASARSVVPILQIWGNDDQTFVPEFVDELNDYCDDLTVLRLADTRHWPMFEQPAVVNRAVAEFLARTATSSRSD